MSSTTTCVYFLYDHAADAVKIGTTGRADRIRRQIAAAPSRRTLIGKISGGRELEAALHRRLRSSRVGHCREWFRWTVEVSDCMRSLGLEKPVRDRCEMDDLGYEIDVLRELVARLRAELDSARDYQHECAKEVTQLRRALTRAHNRRAS